MQYGKSFEEEQNLSDEIRIKATSAQLGIQYYPYHVRI